MSEKMRIDAIQIGERYRKYIGNIEALAQSIADVGLLHPVVVTPDGELVAGQRRLAAIKLLGWTTVPVTVVDPGANPTNLVNAVRKLQDDDQRAFVEFCDGKREDWKKAVYEWNASFDDAADECAVCGYSLFIERHHFLPKSLGGDNVPENMIPLCSTHHRGVHWLMRDLNVSNVRERCDWMLSGGKEDPALYRFYHKRIAPIVEAMKGWTT